MIKTIAKIETIAMIEVNIKVLHIAYPYNVQKEIPVVFHNGSNYDYHFIIKNLANELEGEFNCLGEYTDKCKTF